MFFTYLRRELAGRRRQTAIVAVGMALAIALVMIVNSVASGVLAPEVGEEHGFPRRSGETHRAGRRTRR